MKSWFGLGHIHNAFSQIAETRNQKRKGKQMMKKKIVSILLALALLVPALPVPAFALEGEAAETRTVVSVENPEEVSVLYETSFEELSLPSQVTAVLDNGETQLVGVTWDSSAYSPNQCVRQSIPGTLTLPEGIGNPDDVMAECSVRVVVPTLVWAEEFEPIEVEYGTYAIGLLNELHPTARVRTAEGKEYILDVMWSPEGSGITEYTPGEYLVMGHLLGGPWGLITVPPQATIRVTVKEPVAIVSVEPLDPVEIWVGTTPEKLAKILQEKYPKVTALLEDGSTEKMSVVWNIANSGYSGESEASYTINGQIQIPYNSKVVNPEQKAATLAITVVPPKPLKTVEAGTWEKLQEAVADPIVSTIILTNDITMEDTLVLERNLVIKSDSSDVIRTLTSVPQKRHFQIEAKAIPEDITEAVRIEFSGVVLDGASVSGGIEQTGEKVEIKGAQITNFASYQVNAENEVENEVNYAASIEQADLTDLHISNCQGNGLYLSETCTISGATIEGTSAEEGSAATIGIKIAGQHSVLQECNVSGFTYGCSADKIRFTATNSNFFGNSTGMDLDAGYCGPFGYSVTFTGCGFYENVKKGLNINQDGWPSLFSVHLDNCKIYENFQGIDVYGARLYTESNTEIHDNVYGIDMFEGQLSLLDSKVYQNSGCGVFSDVARITSIENCEIYQNGSEENGGGGIAIRTYHNGNGSSTEIVNTKIYENISNNKVDYGYAPTAGLSISSSISNTLIQDCEIYNNHGDDTPGGIYLESAQNNTATITDCLIHDNSSSRSKGGGACILALNIQVTVSNCQFHDNSARRGGGVNIHAASLGTVSFSNGCEFTGNTAEYTGGAIELTSNGCLSTDEVTVFSGNTAANAEASPNNADTVYPTIKYASTSIYEHPINNYDISYCSGIRDEYVTGVITKVPDQNAYFGTPPSELVLPEEVEISLDTSGRTTVGVDWSNSGYDPTVSGEQIIKGALVLGEHMLNLDDYSVSAKVNVYDPNTIVSCTGMDDTINVMRESRENIADIISKSSRLPEESVVTMGDGRIYRVPIQWDIDEIYAAPPQESNYPSYYWIKGKADFSVIPNLDEQPKSDPCFKLVDLWNFWGNDILEVIPDSELVVEIGTTGEQLLNLLNTTYPRMCATFGLEGRIGYKMFDVNWDVAGSDFDSTSESEYTIYGNLIMDGDGSAADIQNPNDVKAEISVTVKKKVREIVSVDEKTIISEQGIYLKPHNKTNAFGTPSSTNTPETATVHLDDDSTEELPVSWHTETFDPYKVTVENSTPQTIEGEVVIPEDSDISNSGGIPAELKVTVTPVSYKLVQANPTEIDVEVYKGTTLEELNQQLEEEGQNEVSILAISGKTTKRTFAKVSLEEDVNSDWGTQKDVCGTYTLTASWSDNISMQRPNSPVVIHINVTVKEPLEITETKLERLDMYQGYIPENTEGIPKTVTAVLEDNSEIEVGVEWDWSLYNRDSLVNPPILGHLTNLPRKAKQPEEEITGNLEIHMIPATYTIQGQTGITSIQAKAGLTLEEIATLSQRDTSGENPFSRTFNLKGAAENGDDVQTDYTVPFVLESEANLEYSPTVIGEHTITATMALPNYIDTSTKPDYDKITLTTLPVAINMLEQKSIMDREGTSFAELDNVPDTVLATLDVTGPDGIAKTAWLPVDWSEEDYCATPEGITEDSPVTQTVTGTLVNVPDYIQLGTEEPVLSITLGREFDILSIRPVQADEVEVRLGTELAAIDSMIDHSAEVTLQCTNGETKVQTVSFELEAEENLHYDPLTIGTYNLKGRLNVGSNVKNPNGLYAEVAVRTAKYAITDAGYVDITIAPIPPEEDVLDHIPSTAPAFFKDGKGNDCEEEVSVEWDISSFDNEVGAFNVLDGTYNLPIYLENPENCQPIAMIYIDDIESQIISMTQLKEEESTNYFSAKTARKLPGFTNHTYLVERVGKDGKAREQVITLYMKER